MIFQSRSVGRRTLLHTGMGLGALATPPLCCLLQPAARELALIFTEIFWIAGFLWFAYRRCRPLQARVWGIGACLLICGIGDVFYNLLPTQSPRYPLHIWPDLIFLVFVWMLLALFAPRLTPLRDGFVFELVVWVFTSCLALWLQLAFILAPTLHAGLTPSYAVCVGWLYAISSAWLFGGMVVDTLRTSSWHRLGLGLAVLLILISDFAQRYDAAGPRVPRDMGAGEVAFEMGLGLLCLSLVALLRRDPGADLAVVPASWRSARVAVGLSGPLGNALLIVGGLKAGVLSLSDATDVNRVLALVWMGWALSHTLGVTLGAALDGLSRSLAVGRPLAEHRAQALPPLEPLSAEPAFFAELHRWAEHYNRLIARINPLLDDHAQTCAVAAADARSEQVLHDMRGPLTIIWQAASALAPATAPATSASLEMRWRQLLMDATVRLGALSERLLAPTTRRTHALGCRVRLAALLAAAWEECLVRHHACDQRAWTLDTLPQEDIWLIAEREIALMALANVLDNAAEAIGEKKGFIRLGWHTDRHTARIDIVDSGPGFDKSVFGRLGRQRVTSRKATGSGLGLLNTAHVLRPFGGDLFFSSPPGMLTRVTLELRRAT